MYIPVQRANMTREQSRRNAFMLSIIYQSVNAAVVYYRKQVCGHTESDVATYERTLNLALEVH